MSSHYKYFQHCSTATPIIPIPRPTAIVFLFRRRVLTLVLNLKSLFCLGFSCVLVVVLFFSICFLFYFRKFTFTCLWACRYPRSPPVTKKGIAHVPMTSVRSTCCFCLCHFASLLQNSWTVFADSILPYSHCRPPPPTGVARSVFYFTHISVLSLFIVLPFVAA